MPSFRRYWINLPLGGKIVGLVSLLILATVFALTFLSIQRERENFRKELLEQAYMLLDATSLTIRDQLYRLQIDEISDVAGVVSKSPDVTEFVVYDTRGRVLADVSGTRSIYSQTTDPLGVRLLELGRNESYTEWQDDQLLVGRAVILGNEAIGAVMTGLSTQPLDQKIRTLTIQGVLLGVVTMIIGWALTLLLSRQITAPLMELADLAGKMAAGNFSIRVAQTSKDEIGRLAGAFNEMATGLQEREWLKDMFGRFVSQEVAQGIREGKIILEGENRTVSVLFCDIRGFTDFSERHTPSEVVKLLNDFLPLVVQAAQKHGGMVNKFGGDSTLIIYGAPYEVQNDALKAVLTALEIRIAVRSMNDRLAGKGENLRVGVGINTGIALAGAVGPMERQEYTVIGNTVNLAARIDGLNKQFPEHDILISSWTYDALGEYRSQFEMVSLGELPIRGRGEPIEIWAVRSKIR
jgi:class 3 adenylate cyclase